MLICSFSHGQAGLFVSEQCRALAVGLGRAGFCHPHPVAEAVTLMKAELSDAGHCAQ